MINSKVVEEQMDAKNCQQQQDSYINFFFLEEEPNEAIL
jgi:hypothetical protein